MIKIVGDIITFPDNTKRRLKLTQLQYLSKLRTDRYIHVHDLIFAVHGTVYVSEGIARVYINQLRAIFGKDSIENCYNAGYKLKINIKIEDGPITKRAKHGFVPN